MKRPCGLKLLGGMGGKNSNHV